ncbi:TIGR02678 family protein [Labedaea rhizosphaerae]|uniref:Uncharacterized protein (TIGR02678 family) n=1 Tax=Labedaea rhizosphaerae TaxID=598644 RepID=A0A4R6SJV6_LABRH|nr:TIGR02678 family protein [Labedaea rhizosphaerae]TDQ04104.1 uncharacterized protein (TIGR02678 family) [Labedaea rhizosphaerae]
MADRRTPEPGTTLLAELSDIDAAEVARCARVLLRHPLLRPGGPDGDLVPLVYRHRAPLQELFATLLGYRLVVERRFARLYKAGAGHDPTRGENALSPRGYAYVTLAMAALTGVGKQVLLSRLVADIRSAATEAGITVTDDLADRRAVTAALRHLIGLGVINETDGTVAGLIGDQPAEALITIDTDLLGQLLAGPLATADTPDELIAQATHPEQLGVEHAVRRQLVEDPVVLHADLPPEHAEWLQRRQRRESMLLERCFGLVTETRAEGVAVTDPEEYLTDIPFPSTGTIARIALLALPELLDPEDALDLDVHRDDGRVPVSAERVRLVCDRLLNDYPTAWSRQATEDRDALPGTVMALLVTQRLAVAEGDGWLLSPAAHRWLPSPDDTPAKSAAPEQPPPEVPGWSLFDDPDAKENP